MSGSNPIQTQTNRHGIPSLLQLAVLLHNYRDEFVLCQPPLPIQKILFGTLATVGKLLGYRGRYKKYSDLELQSQGEHKAEAFI